MTTDNRPLRESIKDEAANERILNRVFARSRSDSEIAEVCDWAADKESDFRYAEQLREAARRLRERA